VVMIAVVDVQIEVPVYLPDGVPCGELALFSPYHESSSFLGQD